MAGMSYVLCTSPLGKTRVSMWRRRRGWGSGPKRGMPSPRRIGIRVRISRRISPSRKKLRIVCPPSIGQPPDDLSGHGRHRRDRAGEGGWNHVFATGEDDHRLFPVRPRAEAQHRLEGAPSHHEGINGVEESLIAVIVPCVCFKPFRQPGDAPVAPGDEAVEARGDEDGRLHGRPVRQGTENVAPHGFTARGVRRSSRRRCG